MKKNDTLLLLLVLAVMTFGLFMIYDASSFIAFRDFSDKYHYIRDQLLWAVLGCISLTIFSKVDYHLFYNLSLPLLITAIGFLIAVFIPGLSITALGASRWINLQVFVLQPAEFVKLSLAIYLAAWFSTKEKGRLMAFILLMAVVLGLIMLQPDMGTASIILLEAVIVYFLSGGKLLHFLIGAPAIFSAGMILIALAPYRAARLTSLLNTGNAFENVSYHVMQILIALGSGGAFGLGVGNSLQKFSYLPENVTDSIFAIIAEEFGFLGAVLLIGFYAAIILRGFFIASHAHDTFGKLLAGAIVAFLGTQIIINLAAMSVLIPLTGVPLPFISYGGSSLIVDLTAIGILLNISSSASMPSHTPAKRFAFRRGKS